MSNQIIKRDIDIWTMLYSIKRKDLSNSLFKKHQITRQMCIVCIQYKGQQLVGRFSEKEPQIYKSSEQN